MKIENTTVCEERKMTRSEMHILKRLAWAENPVSAQSLPNGNGHCDPIQNRYASGEVLRRMRLAGLVQFISLYPDHRGYRITDKGREALKSGENQ